MPLAHATSLSASEGPRPIERLGVTGAGRDEVVVSVDQLGNVVEWPASPAAWVARACEIAGRSLNTAEHERYLDWSDSTGACQPSDR